MFNDFYPSRMARSSYDIDYERLYDQGYRGIIYDIDNTLVEHGADANEQSIELFKKLLGLGFSICLLSNNKRERVKRFYDGLVAANVNMSRVYYIYDAKKPSRKNYRNAMKMMSTSKKNTCFIGDQLFTDVYGANRTGIKSLLVKPINKKEEIQIVLKRRIEKIVLHFYKQDRWLRLKNSNLVLVGFMGSGKTTVGQMLAKQWGFQFLDTDQLIEERAGMTINEYFSKHGEPAFRKLEKQVLKELLRETKKTIICTGGGMPVKGYNRRSLKKLGYVVYLKANYRTIIERLKDDTTRPLLNRPDKEDAVKSLLKEREKFYRKASVLTIMVDNKQPVDIVEEIEISI